MNNINPKISIIIPCYNQGEFMQEALDSLFAQTYQDFEIIIIDNASIDNTKELIKRNILANILTLEVNQGIAGAAALGFKKARGEFSVGFAQDDKYESTYFEKAIKIFNENPEIGVVTTDLEFFGDQTGVYVKGNQWTMEAQLDANQIHGGSMFRREILGTEGWDINAKECGDWEMWLRACNQGWKLGYIPEPLYQYRIHSNQVMGARSTPQSSIDYIRNKYKNKI
jgi:glycosyltransferase involved in cell wall biosynthesis